LQAVLQHCSAFLTAFSIGDVTLQRAAAASLLTDGQTHELHCIAVHQLSLKNRLTLVHAMMCCQEVPSGE